VANYYLEQIEAPTVEPVTLTEAIQQCHALSGVEDEWFLSRIKAGRKKVEDYTKRSLVEQSWRLTYDKAPMVVTLPRSPVQRILQVTTNGELVPALSYELTKGFPSRLFLDVSLSSEPLEIEYVAGYAEKSLIPGPLLDAILLFVSWSYEHRAGEEDVPKAFYNLIEPYRLSV